MPICQGFNLKEFQKMNCVICGNKAQEVASFIGGYGYRCISCGHYEITGTVAALDQWINLPPSGRLQALAKAKVNAKAGELPKIASYCL
jgi:hypothetical protein